MAIRRGDLVIAAIAGDDGKLRPTLIIRDDAFQELASLTVLPLTSELHEIPPIRIDIEPTRENGLRARSQIMIDKTATLPRRKIGQRIGRVDSATMQAVDRALARFLGLVE